MEEILHPITGEKGFFVSERAKELIDILVKDLVVGQLIVQASTHSEECGVEIE